MNKDEDAGITEYIEEDLSELFPNSTFLFLTYTLPYNKKEANSVLDKWNLNCQQGLLFGDPKMHLIVISVFICSL